MQQSESNFLTFTINEVLDAHCVPSNLENLYSVFYSPQSKYGPGMPYVVLGVITVVGGLACLLLPETLNQNLPDTLHDGETFFADQPLCYNPCAR